MTFNLDFGVLRERRARRLVGSEFSSLIGDLMVLTAMPFVVTSIGGSATEIGFALGAQALAMAVMLPVGGVVGDRLPRRSVMVGADVLRFGSQAMIAILLVTGEAAYWQLIVAQLVHGVGTGFFMPASMSIVPDLVPEAAVQPTNGLKQAGRAVAGVGGPAVGAVAVAAASPGFAMGIDAATFLVSGLLLAGLPAKAPVQERVHSLRVELRRGLREFREGWREFLRLSWMRTVVFQFTLVNSLVVAPFYVFGPVVSAESFGGADAWAIMLACMAVGDFLGAGVASAWRPHRPLVAGALAFGLWVVPLLLLAMLAPIGVLAAAAFIAGVGQTAFTVLWETTVQTHVPDGQRSRLVSIDQFGSLAVVPFGFIVGGWIEETIGAGPGLVGGAAFLVAATLLVLATPSVRQLRSTDAAGGDHANGRNASGEGIPAVSTYRPRSETA